MPRIVGQLLDVELVPAFVNQTNGRTRPAFTQLHVLEGREVYKVRMPQGHSGRIPEKGSDVSVEVDVSAYAGQRGAVITFDFRDFIVESANGRRVSSVPAPASAGS